jgi:hypothetical protein
MSGVEYGSPQKTAFRDPLTYEIFCDPVILTQTGITYERFVIEAHLVSKKTCPVTGAILEDLQPLYKPNLALRSCIIELQESKYLSSNMCPCIDAHRITIHDRIGSGGGGEVWAATIAFPSGQTLPVAVKTPDPGGGTAAELRVTREIVNLGRMLDRRCSHVARLIGETSLGDRRCIVMARYEGSLADAVAARASTLPPLLRLLGYALDIVRGVSQVHDAGLCHLDLRPENVLLRRADDTLVVADLDLSVELEDSPAARADRSAQLSQAVGFPSFISPEGWTVG